MSAKLSADRGLHARLRLACLRMWRRMSYALRYAGQAISIDPTAIVSSRSIIQIRGGGSIVIGRNCEIHDYAMIVTYGGDIRMGDSCSLNPFAIVYGHGGVKIGNGVRIAAHSVIIPANHRIDAGDTPLVSSGLAAIGINIDEDVWIGAGCHILDGVSIGAGAVIGAGSVVTRSVENRTIVAGVPARFLRRR